MKKFILIVALFSSVSLLAQTTTGYTGTGTDTKSKVKEKGRNYNQNYMVQNNEAMYKFGEDSLNKYIYAKLYSTPEFLANTADGHVLVSFEVNFDTKVVNVNVIEGLGNSVDDAVKRIIKGIDDFIPAKQNGIDYRSEIIMDLPIKAR